MVKVHCCRCPDMFPVLNCDAPKENSVVFTTDLRCAWTARRESIGVHLIKTANCRGGALPAARPHLELLLLAAASVAQGREHAGARNTPWGCIYPKFSHRDPHLPVLPAHSLCISRFFGFPCVGRSEVPGLRCVVACIPRGTACALDSGHGRWSGSSWMLREAIQFHCHRLTGALLRCNHPTAPKALVK
jgi:hypothetical protein